MSTAKQSPHERQTASERTSPTHGRGRKHQPDSARRSPMTATVPRSAKRTAGRVATAAIPAHIRAVGVPLADADKAYLRRKLGRKLGKFARRIERISVRIEDVNGPRGGIDKLCRIKVVLSGLPSTVIEERHHSLQAAMDGALARMERAVRAAQSRGGKRTKQKRAARSRARRVLAAVAGD